jgi:hypothetical protein
LSRHLHFSHGEIDGLVCEWWDDGGLRSFSIYNDGIKAWPAIEAEKGGHPELRYHEDCVSAC